eukprot:Pgem_evm1s7539
MSGLINIGNLGVQANRNSASSPTNSFSAPPMVNVFEPQALNQNLMNHQKLQQQIHVENDKLNQRRQQLTFQLQQQQQFGQQNPDLIFQLNEIGQKQQQLDQLLQTSNVNVQMLQQQQQQQQQQHHQQQHHQQQQMLLLQQAQQQGMTPQQFIQKQQLQQQQMFGNNNNNNN